MGVPTLEHRDEQEWRLLGSASLRSGSGRAAGLLGGRSWGGPRAARDRGLRGQVAVSIGLSKSCGDMAAGGAVVSQMALFLA